MYYGLQRGGEIVWSISFWGRGLQVSLVTTILEVVGMRDAPLPY